MHSGTAKKLPLDGVRAINFCWYWVGATITHILADMGAEVIKVDSRARLEVLKSIPPYLGGITDPDRSLWPHNISRNNLGITANLDTQKGRDLIKELVREVDIVAENWTPGTMRKLGLDYQALRRIKPDLIMISPSAAGQWGPLHRINTFGSVLSCLAGIDTIQGYEGERPMPFGMAITDPAAGLVGAYAVLAALRHRAITGEGRYIDFSQWEAMTTMLGAPILDYQWNGRVPAPMGNRDPLWVPHNVYPSKPSPGAPQGAGGSWVCIAVYSDDEWEGLCRALGDPAWRREPRFADKFRRKRHEEDLDDLIAQWTRQRTHYDAAAALQKEGVPAFPALSARDLFTDPHYRARNDWVEIEHPLGRETIYGIHWKFSDTPGAIRLPCPLIGQHNDRIFGELLGHPTDDIEALKAAKAIY